MKAEPGGGGGVGWGGGGGGASFSCIAVMKRATAESL